MHPLKKKLKPLSTSHTHMRTLGKTLRLQSGFDYYRNTAFHKNKIYAKGLQ